MQAYVDELARCQQLLIDLYVDRAGVNSEEITFLMAQETMLTPEQVMSLGFATAIVQPMTALAKVSLTAPKPAESANKFMKSAKQMLGDLAYNIKAFANGVTELKALAVKTAAGTALNVDTGERTTYAEGDAVTNEDGTAVADGDVTLEDGTVLTVAGGKITKVTAPDASAKKDEDPVTAILLNAMTAVTAAMGEMRTEIAALKAGAPKAQTADVTALKGQMDEIKASVAQMAAGMSTGGKDPLKAGEENGSEGDPAAAAAAAAAAARAAKRQPRSERLYI